MRLSLVAVIISGALVLGGCANKGLRQMESTSLGPDEFLILPNKPLTAPKDYEVLPPPTPGGVNLVDQNPNADAIVALGGRAPAAATNGVPASDGTLVAQASRYGVPSNTRASLAEDDAKFRKRQSRLSSFKLFPVDRYAQAYRKQNLDPYAETRRYRGAGYPTPSSPPEQD